MGILDNHQHKSESAQSCYNSLYHIYFQNRENNDPVAIVVSIDIPELPPGT